MVTKTLVCSICGQEYTKTDTECKVADNKVHKFVKLADNLKKRCKDTLVCKICGREWGGDSTCTVSKDKKHNFTKLVVNY